MWLQRIRNGWEAAPVVWLSGVRRVGKTVLAQALGAPVFLNCDLPSTARRLADPEAFFGSLPGGPVVLDEAHQIEDPSRVLKIAADAFPGLRVLATGSSTLAATAKFRDSLTGRKRAVHLTPVLYREIGAFGGASVEKRLLHGGLPPVLLAEKVDPSWFAEWLDSYYARDIQELFNVQKRREFLLLVETLMRQSGGLVELTSLSRDCGLARPTVASYLQALETTHVARSLRPFHAGASRELRRQPKVYGFDTGLVCHLRGWDQLRPDDFGLLWEHLVLDELVTHPATPRVHYWRDKSGHEVDFVIPAGRRSCLAIEAKWNPDQFDPAALIAFRSAYPDGENWVVCPGIAEPYEHRFGSLTASFGEPAHAVRGGGGT
jgi:predicted AAA+ superfamily ATPase